MEFKAKVIRDGTGQRDRTLRSQAPDYVSIDEQTLADWIRFAQTYAKKLKYFNERNQLEGDWSAFFAGDAEAMAKAIEQLESKDAIQAAGGVAPPPSPQNSSRR